MKTQEVYKSANEVKHASPASWPPPWLADSRSISTESTAKTKVSAATLPQVPPLAIADEEIEFTAVAVESLVPCPECGSLAFWEDVYRNRHCQQCRPIRRALALADLAARIRSRKKK